ncbi:hypothetical protein BDFG_05166 [Blastomyces dermatitidis ATCC 26199]|nr:hypothetical protein BDFG_05166 [Blastomyces dermatitidis ATCC 26199]
MQSLGYNLFLLKRASPLEKSQFSTLFRSVLIPHLTTNDNSISTSVYLRFQPANPNTLSIHTIDQINRSHQISPNLTKSHQIGRIFQQIYGYGEWKLVRPLTLGFFSLVADNFTTEIRRGTVTYDNVAAFHFAIEVGADEKMVREVFEWSKLKKGNDDVKGRGFKLVRLGPGSTDPNHGIGSSLSPPGGERGRRLKGNGEPNALGQRWALMVVMTSLKLWWLNVAGSANTTVIGKGEEIHYNRSVPTHYIANRHDFCWYAISSPDKRSRFPLPGRLSKAKRPTLKPSLKTQGPAMLYIVGPSFIVEGLRDGYSLINNIGNKVHPIGGVWGEATVVPKSIEAS